MADDPVRVLLVDDEDSLRQPLAHWLVREYGYEVETAAAGLEASATNAPIVAPVA